MTLVKTFILFCKKKSGADVVESENRVPSSSRMTIPIHVEMASQVGSQDSHLLLSSQGDFIPGKKLKLFNMWFRLEIK